jgi:two-component system sensor histidine kinase/response regulator
MNKGLKAWKYLRGSEPEFTSNHIAVNATCLIALGLLLMLFVSDLVEGLMNAALLLFGFMIILSFLYYLSRYKRKYNPVIVIFSVASYLALIGNYFSNGGINGPTILGFFLTFLLLTSITKKQYHLLIGLLHVGILTALFFTEFKAPHSVFVQYASPYMRINDWIASYIISLLFTYVIISFLRNSYTRERELAEKQNIELQNIMVEKDRLFSLVAHDVRSPLGLIQSYLELITESDLGEQEAEIKKDLLNLTKRTSDMLSNMLTWSKSQMEGVKLRLQTLSIHELIADKLAIYKSIAQRKGIKIVYVSRPDIEVVADKEMTKAVLRNLLSNAIKFTHRNGEIHITVSKSDTHCDIAIQDTGIGISKEREKDIFSIKSAATYGTENEKGIGLGLALSKEFMELQNGKIQYKSVPSIGTIFTISLPAKI